jgi:hypothetical protein
MSLIKEIIKNLTEGTISDDIEWKLYENIFNSDTQKYFQTFSVDKKTMFLVQIYLNDKLKPKSVNLHIHNKDLVNGFEMFFDRDYKEISQLGDVVFEKYMKPLITQKNNNDTYEVILSNIFSKQNKRDRRIDAILQNPNNPIPSSAADEEVKSDIENKPKSFLNKLFGK